jgi:hypothetical protein
MKDSSFFCEAESRREGRLAPGVFCEGLLLEDLVVHTLHTHCESGDGGGPPRISDPLHPLPNCWEQPDCWGILECIFLHVGKF